MACPMPGGCVVPWAHGVLDSNLSLVIPKISISMIKMVMVHPIHHSYTHTAISSILLLYNKPTESFNCVSVTTGFGPVTLVAHS